MARKAIVDRDIILDMLREGETTQYIAEKFGVSRQAIDLHRRHFINRGLLPNQRATGIRRAAQEAIPPERKPASSKEPVPTEHQIISLDEQIDLIIKAFSALKRLPELEAELETYKGKYADAAQEIEQLQQAEKKRHDQERRWLLVQRQGDTDTLPERSDETGRAAG